MIKDTLYEKGKLHNLDVDLGNVDRLAQAAHKTLVSMPYDWDIIILHLLSDHAKIRPTFPQLWENEEGEQERAIVEHDCQLVEYLGDKTAGFFCDCMPEASSARFIKWLTANMFFNRKTGMYLEPKVYTYKMSSKKFHTVHVVGVDTPKARIRPVNPLQFPIVFESAPPQQDVITRSKMALSDPADLAKKLTGTVDVHKVAVEIKGELAGKA